MKVYLTIMNTHKRQTSICMSLAGLEPTIPAGELTQTYGLEGKATGIG
jgi:hypothetical protein